MRFLQASYGAFVSIAMALYTHAFDRAFAAAKGFLGVSILEIELAMLEKTCIHGWDKPVAVALGADCAWSQSRVKCEHSWKTKDKKARSSIL